MGWLDRLLGRTPLPPSVPAAAVSPPVQESLLYGVSDPDLLLPATGGGSQYYRPLTRQADRDLAPMTQERMISLSVQLYDGNNLAKRILELTRDMICGEGVTIQAGIPPEDDIREQEGGTSGEGGDDDAATRARNAVQDILDRHWYDSVNNWDLKIHDRVLELGLFGEQVWTVAVNTDGHVRVSSIDPGLVTAVHVDARNPEIVTAVEVRKGDSIGRSGDDSLYFRAIHADEDPRSPSFGRLVGAAEGETFTIRNADGSVQKEIPYAGSCFYFAVNKISHARRGRSDLLPLIDWVDAYDQYLFSEMERGQFLKAFVWDVQIEGASQADIAGYEKQYPTGPKPGSVRWHNEKVKWTAESPDLKAVDSQVFGDMLLSYISVGAGVSKTWLAGVMDVNRATASSLSEPTYKRMSARQRFVKAMLVTLTNFVLDQAELAGRLPRRPNAAGSHYPQPWVFEVQMPELAQKDLATGAAAVQQTSAALTAMLADRVIDREVAQQTAAVVLGNLGVDVDLSAMRERIAEEEAADELRPYPSNLPVDDRAMTPGLAVASGGRVTDAELAQLTGRRNGTAREVPA